MDLSVTEENTLLDVSKLAKWYAANKPLVMEITVTAKQVEALKRISKKAKDGRVILRDGSADHISISKAGVMYLGYLLNTRATRKSRRRADTLDIFKDGL